MKRVALALLAAVGLTGCPATLPRVPKTVEVPIAVSCTEKRIERPAFVTDRQLALADDYTLVLELGADRLKRQGYEGQLEAQIKGCQ